MKRWQFRVEIYAGSVLGWVDITDDVRGDLSISRGRSSEGYRADPGKCGFRLDNRSGRYSPRNPASDLYGLIGKNTLVRVSAGPIGGSLVGRFFGEIPSWPPRWSLSGADRYVDLDAAGVLRRFRQGDQPVLSPMRRTIEASNPVAYWPGEDGVLSGQAGSATSGMAPLTTTGTVTFKAVDDYVFATSATVFGTTALPDLAAGGKLSASLPTTATTATAGGPWTVHAAVLVDNLGTLSGDVVLLEWTTTSGTYTRWQIKVTTTARTQLIGFPPVGSSVLLIDHASASPTFHHFAASASVSGGTVTVRLQTSNNVNLTAAFAGTLGGVTAVTVNATAVTSSNAMPAGHIAVWAAAPIPVAIAGANDSYGVFVRESRRSNLGEAAVDRLIRLAAETGLDLDATPALSWLVSRMNVQQAASTTSAIDEAIAVDGGLLFESRDSAELVYRNRGELYNRTPVAVAYTGQTTAPFDPVDDVDDVRNDVTVERRNGSSARAVERTGPLAAVPPPAGVGVYTTSDTLNVLADSDLPDQAGWRLHLGTVDEPRYPAITCELSEPSWLAAPSLRAQLLALDVGGVLEVTEPPAWVSGEVRTLVTGYSETISEYTWSITFNGVPASPWTVAAVDGAPRVAGVGSGLATGLGASALSMLLSSTIDNGPWTEDPTDFPQDIRVGGEQVTASAISPAVVDTFTRSVASSWGTADTGQAWTTTGGAASDYSVSGGSARHLHTATGSLHHAFVAPGGTRNFTVVFDVQIPVMPSGAGITVWAVVRGSGTGDYYAAQLMVAPGGATTLTWFKRVSGALSAVSSAIAVGTHTSGAVWRIRAAVLGSSLHARAWIPATMGEPGYQAIGSDSALSAGTQVGVLSRLESGNSNSLPVTVFVDGVNVINPQTVTLSARGVGGVQRAWPAGTEVDVWQPAIAAL